MIILAKGIEHSLIILTKLQNDTDLQEQGIEIWTECFQNGREQGLVFNVYQKDTLNKMSYCIYEHRNSDEIIINGKQKWTGFNGELPYKADNKHVYYAHFDYNKDYEAYEWLKEALLLFYNKGEIKEA